MSEKKKIACEFFKSKEDYLDTDKREVSTSALPGGGTKASAHVAHPSGQWIQTGEAFATSSGIELVYHTLDNGEIAFELYGCELEFRLPDTPFNPETQLTLTCAAKTIPAPPLDFD